MLMALSADGAAAGEFAVANCQADPLNFSTRAFDDFATRGMKIRRACDPEGPGLRGLITSNVVRDGRVQRGAVAMATISAPAGNTVHELPLGGHGAAARLPLRAAALCRGARHRPDRDQERARKPALPAPTRAQAAGYRSRTFNVTGATRIVQRVICVGGDGRKSCSARGSNYLRTYEAEVGIADVLAPAAAIIGDTPLARGEWVRGTQPLNYDASDNVGVRMAHAVGAGKSGGFEQRPCAIASLEEAHTPIVSPARTARVISL